MSIKNYFEYLPNFEYVSRLPGSNKISDYTEVKNLFRRGFINEEIFQDLTYFEKYSIVGDKRPDQVAFELYQSEKLDWVIMLCNNIMNKQSEWPLDNLSYYNYLQRKYGSEQNLSKIHHYESDEVAMSTGEIVLKKGTRINKDFSVSFYDAGLDVNVTRTNISYPVTNQQYEDKINDDKREIFVVKQEYLLLIIDEFMDAMKVKPGSVQYASRTSSRGDNIRIYE